MKICKLSLVTLGCLVLPLVAFGATVNIDLSGASSGTLITAPGGSFASIFAGQSIVSGTGISGSPTGPLTLLPTNNLDVAFWDPIVAPAANSILPEPGNQGPISILLASEADSLSFTAGSADGGDSLSLAFFAPSGSLVDSVSVTLAPNYANYTLSSLPDFAGVSIYNDTDSEGLRFEDISYNAVSSAIPEPASMLLFGSGLIGLAGVLRRKLIK